MPFELADELAAVAVAEAGARSLVVRRASITGA
jgi:hypothetical protein